MPRQTPKPNVGFLSRLFGRESSENPPVSPSIPTLMTKQTLAPKRKHSPAATSKPWLVFDTETTGIWHKHEPVGVVQVAAILFDENGNEIEEFISLVHPERSIPRDASNIHGIRDKDVKNAPSRREVAKALRPLFKRARFVVAHNAPFDAYAADWLGISHETWVCTMGMTHSLVGGKWPRLDEAAEVCSIAVDPDLMHDAAYDARIAARIYLSLKADGVDDHGGYWR